MGDHWLRFMGDHWLRFMGDRWLRFMGDHWLRLSLVALILGCANSNTYL
jgi:hypothetical protein